MDDTAYYHLKALQKAWLDVQHSLSAFECVSSITKDITGFICESLPDAFRVDLPCWFAAI